MLKKKKNKLINLIISLNLYINAIFIVYAKTDLVNICYYYKRTHMTNDAKQSNSILLYVFFKSISFCHQLMNDL